MRKQQFNIIYSQHHLTFHSQAENREELIADQQALCIFNNLKPQLTDDVLQLLKDSFIDTVFVPANCTNQLQPSDLTVNNPAKDFLKTKFEEWYSEQVFINGTTALIKFPLSIMKPVCAQ